MLITENATKQKGDRFIRESDKWMNNKNQVILFIRSDVELSKNAEKKNNQHVFLKTSFIFFGL